MSVLQSSDLIYYLFAGIWQETAAEECDGEPVGG